MKSHLHFVLILSFIVSPFFSMAQSTFTVGAQYKPRFEYRNGFKTPILENQNPAYFVEQRARLWVDYITGKFQIHINVQDVRMWGATTQIYKADGLQDGSLTNFFEAYGTYFISDRWAVKVGRQVWSYDHQRFLGGLDWAMQGRSHDGVLFTCNNPDRGMQIHVGGALNQLKKEPGYLVAGPYPIYQGNYKNMAFIWANKDFGKFDISLLIHNDGREAVNVDTTGAVSYSGVEYHRQTIGLIPTYNADNFAVGGEFYYQLGKNGAGQDISAYLINAFFTIKTNLTPITIGADFASGTQWDSDGTTDNSWNPLYGTNHKFYGYMDYFYVGNAHGQSGRISGLIDIHLKTNFKLAEKHSLAATLHYFMSPVDVVDLNTIAAPQPTILSSGLGTEIDLVYKAVLAKGVAGFVGYSQMFATESMNNIKGIASADVNLNNWVWVGLNFSGDVFTHSK